MQKIKLETVDSLILSMLFLNVLFLYWARVNLTYIVYITLGFIVLRFIVFTRGFRIEIRHIPEWILLILVVTMFIINCSMSGGSNLPGNVQVLLINAALILYMTYLAKNKRDYLYRFFRKALVPLNVYNWINNIIMIIQLRGTGFLMDYNELNSMYQDHVTGFIGRDGTHCVALFSVFIMVLDFYYIHTVSPRYRLLAWINDIASVLVSVIIATQSDNNGLLLMVPVTFVVYVLFSMGNNIIRILSRIWKPLLLGLGLFAILAGVMFLRIPELRDIQERLMQTVGTYSFGDNGVSASDERFLFTSFALEAGGVFGKGWGSITMLSEPSIDLHFGMAAIQPMLYMGGWLPLACYIIFYSIRLSNGRKDYVRRLVGFSLLLLLLTYYMQIFIVDRMTIFFGFFVMALSIVDDKTSHDYKAVSSDRPSPATERSQNV